MSLSPYHKVWLESHPHRDAEWLKTALMAGFDIHHLDGDHDNDVPGNLILIEVGDHQRIHNGIVINFTRNGRGSWEGHNRRIILGEESYKLRESGLPWREVGVRLYPGGKNPTGYSINVAKMYAEYHKLQWPIPHREFCTCSRCSVKQRSNK